MNSPVTRIRPKKLPDERGRHLSPTAVGAIVGVTADTVRRWVALGLLPADRLGPGRRIMIDPADLDGLYSHDHPDSTVSGRSAD